MAKTDASWYSSSMAVPQIKQVLGQVLARAEVSELNHGPLSGAAALGILVEKRPSFFSKGRASAQIIVHERGDHRRIEFIAIGASAMESLATGIGGPGESFGSRVSAGNNLPKLRKSKKLVAECVAALQSVDPKFKQVG